VRKLLYVFAFILVIGALAGGNKNNNPGSGSKTTSYATTTSNGSSNFIDDVHEKVIRDAEREYQIASSSGSDVDRCVQAGMVAAAYLQAHNQQSYQSWKMREDRDCHH
jgi:hypothetical protein